MEGWKFWWGIAAFFLGGLSTQLNGWITYRRQRADKAADATNALRKRREEFELQHLVEFNQLLRQVIEKIHDYHQAVRWEVAVRQIDPRDEAPRRRREEIGEAFQVALSSVTAQLGFILADDVREAAGDLVVHMAEAGGRLRGSDDFDAMGLAHAADSVYGALGERVRSIYAGQTGP